MPFMGIIDKCKSSTIRIKPPKIEVSNEPGIKLQDHDHHLSSSFGGVGEFDFYLTECMFVLCCVFFCVLMCRTYEYIK